MSTQADTLWVEATGGYEVAYNEGHIICRNSKGKILPALPSRLKNCEVVEELRQISDLLAEHERNCAETVDYWMLRSLPVPTRVITSVWEDPAWRRPLKNALVAPMGFEQMEIDHIGFLRFADESRGIGLLNLEGEMIWLDAQAVLIPHPAHLPGLEELRALALKRDLKQGLCQLFREIYSRGIDHGDDQYTLRDFAEGRFEQLSDAVAKCRSMGYQTMGGFAVCSVWEDERLVEARYWIGSDAREYETYTGELLWVDEDERSLVLSEVGPVAFSEGMRMAMGIYEGRVIEDL